ncbi:MAG: hypothetical protein PVI57_21670 [Gemmatimonadota bacterium]|jgi:V/A-type H+-transporting ATPase subunit E
MARGDRRGPADGSGGPDQGQDPSESTLEAFVARLHDEGVEAGRKEAERLVRDARREAEDVLGHARAEAERIIADAEARADRDVRRGRAELELAARDTVLDLTGSLARGLGEILGRAVEQELREPDVVRELLREVVRAYASADADGARTVHARVPEGMKEDVERWAFGELAREMDGAGPIGLSATLEEAGFEYRVTDGTVEVSVDAAVELLMRFLTPRLGEALRRAADGPHEPGANGGTSESGVVASASPGSA